MNQFRFFLNLAKLTGLFVSIAGIGFSKSLEAIGLSIYMAAFFLQLLAGRDEPLQTIPKLKIFILFFSYLALVLFINHQYFMTSLEGAMKYVGGFLLMFAIVDVGSDRRRFYLILNALLAMYALSGLAGLSQKFFGYDFIHFRPPFLDNGQTRLLGQFKHYNDYGTLLLPGVVLSLAYFAAGVRQKKKGQILLGALIFLMLSFVLVNTFSRSAFISCAAAVFVLCAFFPSRKWTFPLFTAGIAAALFCVPSLAQRFLHIFSLTQESTSERLMLMNVAWKMILKNPLFGLGINTYSIYFPHFKPADYPGAMYAHNSYLQIGSEIGLIGLGLYFLSIGSVLTQVFAGIQKAPESSGTKILTAGFFCAAIGLLVNGCFESLLQSTQLRALFWILMGFMIAAGRLRERA